MANPKPTAEELLAEDERLRREFAKAFGWGMTLENYDPAKKERSATPSWEEIFIQVGKLLVLEELKKKVIPINFEPFNPHPPRT